MSISQDSPATVVCREVFDETSHPSNEEVLDYARRLGIDPDAEPHLLNLAREGLMARLPKGWSPCYHEVTGAFYYFQESTGTTTWEHPLDAVYRKYVEEARHGNTRRTSLEEDSKTTVKDLESHEDATLPKELSLPQEASVSKNSTSTKIPTKLAPLKKTKFEGASHKEPSVDKIYNRRGSDCRQDSFNTLMIDRASRDYTNLRFQDPKFYESPRLLEKNELDLKEVLKRSESLSPRHEKDWEQLSSKFSSEENIIDIDKLNVNATTRSEKSVEKFDKEKHPKQLGQQKELTLSGGGFMFLKSNRSRDTTPSQDGGKVEDFQAFQVLDDANNATEERPKSILREKGSEDDERPMDEERKSVRFDLEKEVNEFTYSGSEDDWDSESGEQKIRISAYVIKKNAAALFSLNRQSTQSIDCDSKDEIKDDEQNESDIDGNSKEKEVSSTERSDSLKKRTTVVGKRFVVENVSENEHFSQITKDSVNELDYLPRKFENVRNIDIVSKSDSDSTRNSDSKSTLLDEIRINKEIMLESMRKTAERVDNDKQREKDKVYQLVKLKHDLEAVTQGRNSKTKCDSPKSLEEFKMHLSEEHNDEIERIKKEFQTKLGEVKKELEDNFLQEKLALEESLKNRLEEAKREMAEKEEQEIQRLIADMDKMRLENLKKVKGELEACYEKERQEILANLKTELDERKRELLELRNQEMDKLEKEHERNLDVEKNAKREELELSKQHSEEIVTIKKQFEKEFEDLRNELRLQQREKIAKITEDHEKCLAEIVRDFRTDEALARKIYKQRLEEIRSEISREMEKESKKQNERVARQESVDFEKMRCEKRLLEDKYKTLKDKYLKLKNDVRLAVERRSKRKEGNATASETERSTSTRTKTERTESSDQKAPLKKTRSNSISSIKTDNNPNQSGAEDSDGQRINTNSNNTSNAAGFQKSTVAVSGVKSASKFESDDTTTASEATSNLIKKKKSFSKKIANTPKLSNNNNSESPVENIRKQLEKLEDLGDQLPSNESAYTLRYPFQDKAPINASSELEFFRHRIHVEKDSVRRAREALKQQRTAFQGRQRAWKQRSARATLEQLVKEERELSDMEVSLHRTRSLLGEKVIHLRHLEQSLERVANAKKLNAESNTAGTKSDELTLSDMSSASSGFSSTDLGTETFIDKPDHYQESTEIIASLENLNSEIREIWGVLNKRQDNNIPPPPTLMYSDLGWLPYQHIASQQNNVSAFGTPNIQSNILSQLTGTHPPTTTTQNIIAQYGPNSGFTTSVGTVERTPSNLMERTRNLRDWLRQARVETTDLVSPGQATL